jgi:hypothetical protein
MVINPLARRYTTRLLHLQYPVVKKTLYSDTMFAKKTKSLRQHTCAQVFTDGIGLTHAFPMKKKSEAGDRLEKLIRTLQTILEAIVTDGAGEEIGGDWKRTIDKYRIQDKCTEPYSPWQNRAEREIRELKKATRQILHSSKAPPRVWCFALEWVTEIRRHNVHDIAALNERTPFKHYMGHTRNITALCTYSFYNYCWFWDSEQGFPDQHRVLGRWLSVSLDIGRPLTYFILPKSCKLITRSSVTPVTPEESLEPVNKALAEELDKAIDEKIGKFRTNKEVAEELGMLFGPSGDLYDGDLDPFDEIEAVEEAVLMPEADEWMLDTFNKYLAAEVLLPHGGELVRAKVTGQKRAADGTPVGVAHSNPILDTREYEVSFPDGSTDCYAANMIAESLYSQVDADGREFILKEIVDHRSDGSAVPVDDTYYIDPNGRTT